MTGIFNVMKYGAKANGTDDFEAIYGALRAANLAGGGVVYFPAGVYDMGRHEQFAGITLSGYNPIKFVGDAAGVSVLRWLAGAYGAMNLFYIKSNSFSAQHMTFNGNRQNLTAPQEQTHFFQVEACTDVRFLNCDFINCPWDAIKAIGGLAVPMTKLVVQDCNFDYCGRSGVTVQRNLTDFRLVNNTFSRISDQAIDFEPTGTAYQPPVRGRIIGNSIQGNGSIVDVTIAGIAGNLRATDILFQDNIITNGTMACVDCDGVRIVNNTIRSPAGQTPLTCSYGFRDAIIDGNTLVATGTAALNLFGVNRDNDRRPLRIRITRNALKSDRTILSLAGVSELHISENSFIGDGSTNSIGIDARSALTLYPTDKISILENHFTDTTKAVRLSSATGRVLRDVQLRRNIVAATVGRTSKVLTVSHDDGITPPGILSSDNVLGSNTTA